MSGVMPQYIFFWLYILNQEQFRHKLLVLPPQECGRASLL